MCYTITMPIVNKKVHNYKDIKENIIRGIDLITLPIASTLSPKGSNIIYEDEMGGLNWTNDGATIAKNLSVVEPIENAIIEIIKGASLKTNLEAGDGTSSTVLMSSILTKEGLKLIDNGYNQMDIRDAINDFTIKMKSVLKPMSKEIKNDKDIELIAKISANNDSVIAKDLVKIIKCAGEDGQIFIDEGYVEDTQIIEDLGFVIRTGIFAPELTDKTLRANMVDVPILITDKRIYYKSEAETILKTVLDAGYNEVVIVAQDFIGEALPFFIANHQNNKVRCILIAEKKLEILEDLAIYLNTEVISDKKGSIVDKITINDFALTKRCFSDRFKTVISRDKKEKNPTLEKRINTLKNEMKSVGNKNDPEYTRLKQRVSSLTNGMVTIKVGGRTRIEMIERIYRYEDAVNATRAALKEGYLPGGGIAVIEAFNKIKIENPDFHKMFRSAIEGNLRQIVLNCGGNPDSILEKVQLAGSGFGYNAVNGKIEDMVKSGIIEPYLVTSQVITNAASIANVILTSRFLFVNDVENYKDNKESNN